MYDDDILLFWFYKDNLTTSDLRQLVIAEEERRQLKRFKRVIPSETSHKYLHFMDKPSYFDKLFDAFEHKYSSQVILF